MCANYFEFSCVYETLKLTVRNQTDVNLEINMEYMECDAVFLSLILFSSKLFVF